MWKRKLYKLQILQKKEIGKKNGKKKLYKLQILQKTKKFGKKMEKKEKTKNTRATWK